jgi:hypothetical protein
MKRFFIILLLLPVAAAIVWWVGVQVYLRLLPSPIWAMQSTGVVSSLAQDNADPSNSTVLAVPVAEHLIPSRRAALVAWQIMRSQVGQNVTIHEGPSLVMIAFPDGLSRLTWRCIALLDLSPTGKQGIAIAAYVDAASGKPLAVVKDIVVVDPALSALTSPADAAYWVILLTNGPLFLLGGYLILLAVLLLVLSILRSLKRMQKRDHK